MAPVLARLCKPRHQADTRLEVNRCLSRPTLAVVNEPAPAMPTCLNTCLKTCIHQPTRNSIAWPARLALMLGALALLGACGGGGGGTEAAPVAVTPPVRATAPAMPPPAASAPPPVAAVVLKAPVLSFTDTGLSVGDGITRNGLWSVTSDDLAWEYSLDQGRNWIKGVGTSFEVQSEGAQMIWVRTRDDLGNTSDIVVVSCVLDITAPDAVAVGPAAQGATNTLQIAGMETGARWEYSLDGQAPWLQGSGTSLGVLGNGLSRVWLRQVDVAGNTSMLQTVVLEQPGAEAWHEASNNPLQPSAMATGSLTLLIHGSVLRNDADYVRWDIPSGHRLVSVRLVHYVSDDQVAFYALQRAAVFDAGVDVNRMLVYGHMGPQDLLRNVVAALAPEQLGAGPVTLWFQQTGLLPTRYAIEVVLQPLP